MAYVVGIDLGTTNSCVSFFSSGQSRILENAEGHRTTPSVVSFTSLGELLVGCAARHQALIHPVDTLYAIKRLIGRRSDDDVVTSIRSSVSYTILQGPNGDAWVASRGKPFSPEQVSSMILRKMRDTAEKGLGGPVEGVVITVPAYFNDAQRQATRDAAHIAGLKVLQIINEPTAAAIAYGAINRLNGRLAVYDLGGGTFDVSILEIKEGVIEVKATNGDTFLGGEDFDAVLIQHFADIFLKESGCDVRRDKMAMQRLKEAAESAKMALSTMKSTRVLIQFLASKDDRPYHLDFELTRATFDRLIGDLADRTIAPCESALRDAGFTPEDIDDVVLVGGMTRVPRVQEVVQRVFRRIPSHTVNPDEAVAIGAAIQADVLSRSDAKQILYDVTPLSLGVEIDGGLFAPIIRRNTSVPARGSQVFSTVQDDQSEVTVRIFQGESDRVRHNRFLGNFDLVGLPKGPKGYAKIEVLFQVDHNGFVKVSAMDLETGSEQSMSIQSSGGLSAADVERMVKESEEQAQFEEHARLLSDYRDTVERYILSFQDHGVKEGDGSPASVVMVSLMGVMESSDLALLKSLCDEASVYFEDFKV